MLERVSFSGQHLELSRIVSHHTDVESALKLYYSPSSPDYVVRFADYVASEVRNELLDRLDEHKRWTVFSILSAVETAFCIDYLQRNYTKKKDPPSRELRALHKRKGSRASLEDDIFDAWKKRTSVPGRLIEDLKGAFKYRHWLAHGRYWEPKLGRRYDYDGVYILAKMVFSSFPLEGAELH